MQNLHTPADLDIKGPEQIFLEALRQEKLLYQITSTNEAVFPPRVAAPQNGGALRWCLSQGVGEIWSVTEQPRRPPEPSHFIAIVTLDEGFKLLSRIESPHCPKIGDRVRAVFHPRVELPYVAFVPTEIP